MLDMLRPILQPFSYMRFEMERINNERDAYESCSRWFSGESPFVQEPSCLSYMLLKYSLEDDFPLELMSSYKCQSLAAVPQVEGLSPGDEVLVAVLWSR
ncbi:hypothetical protein BC829DRAFT_112760 [Chytridium lagenaria]|nr:hypothetical protein BC829DRAFT_112760 [Chytridium lagenaria]